MDGIMKVVIDMIYPIQVLQIAIGGCEYGGVENYLYQNYKYIEHKKVKFSFFFLKGNSLKSKMNSQVIKDCEIESLAPPDGLLGYFRVIFYLLKKIDRKKYHIVHINTGSLVVTFVCISIAALKGVKMRISHSHSTHSVGNVASNDVTKRLIKIMTPFMQAVVILLSTHLFACSQDAGRSLFGKLGIRSRKFRIMPNAIEIDKFIFDQDVRRKVREQLGICESTFVIGHVGRFDENKNQIFLLEILRKQLDHHADVILLLIGDGDNLSRVKKNAICKGIDNAVLFLGRRSDVSDLMQAMDVFVLPSYFEGLSIVTIEAQTAGLPVFLSDTLSREHKVTDDVYFLPISAGAEKWAQCIRRRESERMDTSKIIKRAGYDIHQSSSVLERVYSKKYIMNKIGIR